MIDLAQSTKTSHFRRLLATQLSATIAQLNSNPRAAALASRLFAFDGGGRVRVPVNLAATAIANAADFEAANVGFRGLMLESAVGQIDPVAELASEVPSNRGTESYKWLGDLPAMQEWKNDRILKQLEAYGFAIKNKKWEATLRVKNDDIADDALGLLPMHVQGMGAQAALQPGILVAQLILNGFDGTAFPELGNGLAFDGAFFFDTTHATGSNKLALPFSGDNLETAMRMLRSQKRFDGSNLYAKGTHLVVGIDDERAAEKVMTAEYLAHATTSAGTETNTLRGKFKILVSPEFQNGEWALADLSGPIKPMLFQNREGIVTNTVGGRSGDGATDMVGFMYDETWFGATARNNAGYLDFRRIIGSKP